MQILEHSWSEKRLSNQLNQQTKQNKKAHLKIVFKSVHLKLSEKRLSSHEPGSGFNTFLFLDHLYNDNNDVLACNVP